MPPLVLPTLVNGASGDPALFVPFLHYRQAYLFDIGDIASLSPRNILKISHIFVTHTHMDHFIGFDYLLRIVLGREKTLHLFGPEGFPGNVAGKLAGYAWNLVGNYSNNLNLEVNELKAGCRLKRRLSCQQGFREISEDITEDVSPNPASPAILHQDAAHAVSAVILDHGLPCLGFSLKENYHINIRKDTLSQLGLAAGPWLQELKQAIYEGTAPEELVEVPAEESKSGKKTFRLGELTDELAVISKGQKISYIADVAYTPANIEKIRRLAHDSDQLFIEASFLEADRDHAMQKKHLTARQAGEIAGLVNAGRFTLFHFSPRYEGSEAVFYEEANAAWQAARPRAGLAR